ncbi:MAG: polysaccharide deacetylase family protein [Rhodospirillales bacterium]
MRARFAAAWPALSAHRAWARVRGPRAGFRAVILHATPDADALSRLVGHIARRHGFADPDNLRPSVSACAHQAPCLMTFDDGFASNYHIAAKVLEDNGARGVFFICPGLHDLKEEDQRAAVSEKIFRGQKAPAEPLMTWDQIWDLVSRGHVIGAHGMTHARLSDLTGAALEDEVLRAAEMVEARTGRRPAWCAWAFGDIDSITPEAMGVLRRAARYVRSGVRGLNGPDVAEHAVRADSVDLSAPPVWRLLALEGALDGRYAKARAQLDAMAAGAAGAAAGAGTEAPGGAGATGE